MNDQEKLRALIPHWIEHNDEHASEFRRWAAVAGSAKADILSAAEASDRASDALESALRMLGGPLPADHPHLTDTI